MDAGVFTFDGPDNLGLPRRQVREALLNGVCGPSLLRAMSSLYMQQRPLVLQSCLTPPLCPQLPIRRACAPRLQRQLRKGSKRSLEVSAQTVAIEDATTINAQAPQIKDSKKKVQDLSPEVAKDLYRDMFLGREFEEMCAQMYYRGKMFGFVHLYSGQEAVSTGEPSQHQAQCYLGAVQWDCMAGISCQADDSTECSWYARGS